MCLRLVFTNDFGASNIGFFISRTLIYINFSSGSHALSVDILPMEAPQPSREASVWIMMLILGYLIGLNALNIFFFHYDILYKVSSYNFIAALKLPLSYLRDLSLNLKMALYYIEPNWFPENEDARVPIKLVNFLIVNYGFVRMRQHFS